MQIGISGPQGKGMKRSSLGIRRSKVKVRLGQIGQICKRDISEMDELILLKLGTSGPHGMDKKRVNIRS